MGFDVCSILNKYQGKAVMYNGKPYILLGTCYKKLEDGRTFGVARLVTPGKNVCYEVSALDVRPTHKRWDYMNAKWVDTFEQTAMECRV